MMNSNEFMQVLLDYVASGQVGARDILMSVSAAGLASGLSAATVQQALTAGETQTLNQAKAKRAYDYIVIGSGASGSIIAGELSKTGADVLVVESGGEDAGTTISNPSIWFYNVGGPLDWTLPIAPVPQLNNRQFNMALGRVLGGGSSVNAMVWTRGTERDYDTWEGHGATGWAFKDVLPTFKAQEDWEGGANDWRGVGGPVHVRTPGDPHPTAPAFLEAARQMGFPIIDDLNGPMRAGAGYINMNIAADGSRASSARAFLRPNLGRPNLTLLLNTHATRILFDGDRASGVEIVSGEVAQPICAALAGTCRTMCSSPAWSIGTEAKSPTAPRTATGSRPRSICRAGWTPIRLTSAWCLSNSRSQRRKRRPGSRRLRKKVSRLRRRWFSLRAAGRSGSRARTGAMRP